MRQLSPNLSHDNGNRVEISPSYPNNPQVVMAASNCLPPLSPLPFLSPAYNQTDTVLTDVVMDDRSIRNHGTFLVPPSIARGNASRVNDGLPPRRGHRRSMSDSVPLGFSAMIQTSPQLIPIRNKVDQNVLVKRDSEWSKDGKSSMDKVDEKKSEGEVVDDLLNSYMNLELIDTLNTSAIEDKDLDCRISGTKTNGNESSDNEVESILKGNSNSNNSPSLIEKRKSHKRSATGDIAPAARHRRSVSMDSYMEDLHFDDYSTDANLNKIKLEFGNGEFSETELKKITADEKLTEIAMLDPKRAKRILANRLSAARSKERKTHYISELEQKVQTLQIEATTLSAQVTVLQQDSATLTSQNNELKFRLQAMEQQAQLKEALNETLVAESQRLKIIAAELSGNSNQNYFQLQNTIRSKTTGGTAVTAPPATKC